MLRAGGGCSFAITTRCCTACGKFTKLLHVPILTSKHISLTVRGKVFEALSSLLFFMEAKYGLRPLWTYSGFAEMTDQWFNGSVVSSPMMKSPLICCGQGLGYSLSISDKLKSHRFWFCKLFASVINLAPISYRNLEDRWWPFQTICIQMRCFGFQVFCGRHQVSAVWRTRCPQPEVKVAVLNRAPDKDRIFISIMSISSSNPVFNP